MLRRSRPIVVGLVVVLVYWLYVGAAFVWGWELPELPPFGYIQS